MSAQHTDRPNLVIFPPLVLAIVLVLAIALQWAAPLGVLSQFDQFWRNITGGGLLVIGIALTQAGARTLLAQGTNVNPRKPAVTLATEGIYQWTRNPMYVGGGPLMIGLAIVFALDWLPLLMVPAAFVLHFGIVRREEQYLIGKFGEEYRRYCARVPRYLPGLAPGHHQ
jgi:protein-S-isoprenylcysteine O-methyltransferase Ste14